jgi:hypothetical protein
LRPVGLPQGLGCRFAQPVIPNAVEIGVDLHADHLHTMS